MKKIIFLTICLLIILAFSGCGEVDFVPEPAPTPTEPESSIDIVDYQVIEEDVLHRMILIVTCEYTNQSGKDNSYLLEFTTKAYQQGVKLEKISCGVWNNDEVNELLNNGTLVLRNGNSIRVASAFLLRDPTPEIEIEIDKVGFDQEIVEYGVYVWRE